MKTFNLSAALLLLVICSGFSKAPDNQPVNMQNVNHYSFVADGFDFFRTHRQGNNGITATWGFTASAVVTGFKVERTYEDPGDPYANWDIVTLMPFTNAKSYKCTDTGVFPGFITYRVTALYANGNQYVSPLSTVHIISH